MKKAILIFATLGIVSTGIAQDKYVTSATTALSQKAYDEAKADIDRAMSSPETSSKPKALFAKARIYMELQTVDKYKSGNPWKEAMQALMKLAEVKADYEKEQVNESLLFGGSMFYNEAAKNYEAKKYMEAIESARNTVKIHDLNGGTRFKKMQNGPILDTLSANAVIIIALCEGMNGNLEASLADYKKAVADPITRTAANYTSLLHTYYEYNKANSNKLTADELAAIQEARKNFPDDVNIRNNELNYYISNNKMSELLKKLEDAAVSLPNSADIQFDLASLYTGMASTKDGKPTADAATMNAKAETALKNAVKLSPENPAYNYALGALLFNQSVTYNDQADAVTGVSAKDNEKVKSLQAKRDETIKKGLPYLEKAYAVYSAKGDNIGNDEKDTYRNVLMALKQAYATLNMADKLKDVSAKYDGLK